MKVNKNAGSLMLVALIFLILLTAVSDAGGVQKRVAFQEGKSSALLEGSVIRGERDVYLVRAMAGQTLRVFVGSLEDNAVFTIVDATTGKALKGSEEGNDTKRFICTLPSTGDYRIIVGGTRGNAEYIMKIEIR
jgi:hypothetical protein